MDGYYTLATQSHAPLTVAGLKSGQAERQLQLRKQKAPKNRYDRD